MNIYERLTKEIEQLLEQCANLKTYETGLPVLLYVSQHQGSHGPRIKFMNKYGDRWLDEYSVSITISDNPKIVAPKNYKLKIKTKEFAKIKQWIIQNKKVLLDFWNDKINNEDELKAKLTPLPFD